jgi:hypothetical protein
LELWVYAKQFIFGGLFVNFFAQAEEEEEEEAKGKKMKTKEEEEEEEVVSSVL